LLELRFIPSANHAVTLNSFDLAGFGANQTVPTIEAVQDINTMSETTLWGPFTNTVVLGSTHTTFTPNVTVTEGHTLSLIFGTDGAKVIGLDNVNFSQTVIPEPAGVAVMSLGVLAVRGWRRRCVQGESSR
jgi:hypothetical protein